MTEKKNRNKKIVALINKGVRIETLAEAIGIDRRAIDKIYTRHGDRAKRIEARKCLICKEKENLISDNIFTICKTCAKSLKNID